MTIIIANDTPPAIRGLLKRWFIEPRPNVFVGSINARTRSKVLDYIRRNGEGIGLLVLYDDDSAQGFAIDTSGDPKRRVHRCSGLQLIAESWEDEEDQC